MNGRNDEPRLHLFLSVDLIGSTALKNRRRSEDLLAQLKPSGNDTLGDVSPPWAAEFREFFEEFPNSFKSKLQEKSLGDLWQTPYGLFKAIGDELVFWFRLQAGAQIEPLLSAFRLTLNEHNKSTSSYKDAGKRSLLVKGAAWLAGTPITNTLVEISEWTDCIGPSIDCGFRLSKLATADHLPLSVDLTWALLRTTNEGNWRSLGLVYLGKHSFKGVLRNAGYPVFAVKTGYAERDQEWSHLLDCSSVTLKDGELRDAMSLIESYIANPFDVDPAEKSWLVKPYIADQAEVSLNSIDEDHIQAYKALERARVRSGETHDSGAESSSSITEIPEPSTEALGNDRNALDES